MENITKGKVFRAGLLPYIMDTGVPRFLFMIPSDERFGGNKFQIAKGKVEPDESSEDAALREATEELGLRLDNIKSFKYLGTYLGRTSIYIAEVKDSTAFNLPHFETGETAWLTLEEFQQVAYTHYSRSHQRGLPDR